ncbi:hypothetical protein EXS70_04655 [Candidatus Peribacteria bacterium]|nr:hypothetical protein [Candidatus Peribacteria bacterium]
MSKTSFAPGKIILSGEYAVVFGFAGIAVPARIGVQAELTEDGTTPLAVTQSDGGSAKYIKSIAKICIKRGGTSSGTLTVTSRLPPGRGMGSSTAIVVAIAKALLGNDRKAALSIEDTVNPGHSGLDFSVIWANAPVISKKGVAPQPLTIDTGFLQSSVLIDTGHPKERTPSLVAWVKEREACGDTGVAAALKTIGECTERLLAGESPRTVFPDHHRAQVALGVVPKPTQDLITAIEAAGGVAKVIGAGGRTGGGGMVLALHKDRSTIEKIAQQHTMPALP